MPHKKVTLCFVMYFLYYYQILILFLCEEGGVDDHVEIARLVVQGHQLATRVPVDVRLVVRTVNPAMNE